jgi:hypothetical protein
LLFVFYDGGDDDGGPPLPNDLLNVEETMSHMQDLLNTNFNYFIRRLCMKPFSKSRVFNPSLSVNTVAYCEVNLRNRCLTFGE